MDWASLFTPTVPLLETALRGTVTYLALFALLRFVHRRQAGTVGIADLLLIVLIADAAQNSMAGEARSITDGVLLVGVLVFWSWFLDWLGFRVPRLERLIHPPPLRLVTDGRVHRRNLKAELITEEELMSHLRLQGVERLEDVKQAHVEPDGRVSVVKQQGDADAHAPESRRAAG
jgi:uncharacterized membrane protein YcaP (DUF421 family)